MNEENFFIYHYVGASEIKDAVASFPSGTIIKSVEVLKQWLDRNKQKYDVNAAIVATFIINLDGYLCLADRHSEHVACSGGKGVLSAGEIFISHIKNKYEVIEISNQSTGFCPQLESWYWVAKALNRISLSHPGRFTIEFIFRRCTRCSQLNIVKDDLFTCEVCKASLPKFWNCDLS